VECNFPLQAAAAARRARRAARPAAPAAARLRTAVRELGYSGLGVVEEAMRLLRGATAHVAAATLLILQRPAAAGGAASASTSQQQQQQQQWKPMIESGGSPCTVDEDCNLNGICQVGRCLCMPEWIGTDCGVLSLAPATQGAGFHEPGSSSWGGSLILEGGMYHLFASRMVGRE
jgi:hypothetical protein